MFLRKRIRTFPILFSLMFVKVDIGKGSSSYWDGGTSAQSRSTEVFDYIIVGGGTAGCVLANRLSENGKHSVLLLEAGGVPPEIMNVPAFANDVNQDPELAFQYFSIPQDYPALGQKTQGTRYRMPLGRVLGGTSQINHMIYNRGHPEDFNNWANITSDLSWSYDHMLPYFMRSQTYLGQFPNPAQHGSNGPIYVSRQDFAPGVDQWLQAGRELGFRTADPNGPQRVSFTPIEFTKQRGRRWSSFEGYLKPIVNQRPNLKIVINAYVTRVLFDGNTAIGVQYNLNKTDTNSKDIMFAHASKEIIISAGTHNSPPILMRSGIGPEEVLDEVGVPILKALPVGENLQMHPRLMLQFVLKNKSLSYDPEAVQTPENFDRYQRFGEGPYTTVVGYGGQAFFASSVAWRDDQNPQWPDIQILLNSVEDPIEQFENVTLAPGETSVNTQVYVSRGRSRGTVKLDPRHPDGQPIIDLNAMSDPRDVQIMLDAIHRAIEIFERTKTYQRQGARLLRYAIPECRQYKFRSDDYWKCYMAQVLVPGDHPVGTCPMNSVVDSSLRVYGVKRLRVVDASVMPVVPNSNLQAVVYAIAEKASEEILHDAELQIIH